jgi:hypothetical protein
VPSVPGTIAPSAPLATLELPTTVPSSDLPTTQPTIAPTGTRTPTKTAKPATANLVVTDFALDDSFILAEAPTNYQATVKNSGTADAGPFSMVVHETNIDTGVQTQSDPENVEGLAAGKTIKVTLSVAIPKPGYWKLTATADSEDTIIESNENDNSADYTAKALPGLPDIVWANDGVTFTPQGPSGSFEVVLDLLGSRDDRPARSEVGAAADVPVAAVDKCGARLEPGTQARFCGASTPRLRKARKLWWGQSNERIEGYEWMILIRV